MAAEPAAAVPALARAQRTRKAPERGSLGYVSPAKKKQASTASRPRPAATEVNDSSQLQARRKVQLRGFPPNAEVWYTGTVRAPAERCDSR